MTHTQGPWKIHRLGRHWNNENLEDLAIVYGNDGEHICDTVYEEGDAHLIAAAPDLLEALENAKSMFPRGTECKIWKAIIDQTNKSIAKAKGTQTYD